MDKIDTSAEDISLVTSENDPISVSIKDCVNKINEMIDKINEITEELNK